MARKDGKAQAKTVKGKARVGKDADTMALERRVSDALGLKVSVDHQGAGGVLHIEYRDLDQLDAVLKKLERELESLSVGLSGRHCGGGEQPKQSSS